jgi:hypothetical protein
MKNKNTKQSKKIIILENERRRERVNLFFTQMV